MYCKTCGKSIYANAVICPSCGCAADSGVSSATITIGYITSFLIPIIGFIMSIYVIFKGKMGHGLTMMILAILSFLFWVGVASS